MKPALFYFGKALDNWCKAHRWDKDLPLTPSFLLQMINDATILMEQDRKKLEDEPAASV